MKKAQRVLCFKQFLTFQKCLSCSYQTIFVQRTYNERQQYRVTGHAYWNAFCCVMQVFEVSTFLPKMSVLWATLKSLHDGIVEDKAKDNADAAVTTKRRFYYSKNRRAYKNCDNATKTKFSTRALPSDHISHGKVLVG